MEEFELWMRAFLKSYEKLEALTGSLDKSVENVWKESFGTISFAGKPMDSYDSCQEIINLTYRKKGLIMAGQRIKQGLGKMSKENKAIIEYRFVKEYSIEKTAQLLKDCRTNIFRQQKLAFADFCEKMRSLGVDLRWCEDNFASEEIFKLFRGAIICESEKGKKKIEESCTFKKKPKGKSELTNCFADLTFLLNAKLVPHQDGAV